MKRDALPKNNNPSLPLPVVPVMKVLGPLLECLSACGGRTRHVVFTVLSEGHERRNRSGVAKPCETCHDNRTVPETNTTSTSADRQENGRRDSWAAGAFWDRLRWMGCGKAQPEETTYNKQPATRTNNGTGKRTGLQYSINPQQRERIPPPRCHRQHATRDNTPQHLNIR